MKQMTMLRILLKTIMNDWIKKKLKLLLYIQMAINLLAVVVNVINIVHFNNAQLIFGLIQIPIFIANWILTGFICFNFLKNFANLKLLDLLLLVGHLLYVLVSLISIIMFFINSVSNIALVINLILNLCYLAFNGVSFTKNINSLEG